MDICVRLVSYPYPDKLDSLLSCPLPVADRERYHVMSIPRTRSNSCSRKICSRKAKTAFENLDLDA